MGERPENLQSESDGLLYRNGKLYIPKSLWRGALKKCSDDKLSEHVGYVKILYLLHRQFWWSRVRKDVSDDTSTCPLCMMNKPCGGRPPGLLCPLETPIRWWSTVTMDFIINLPPGKGKTVIWIVVNASLKQAHSIPCQPLTAKELNCLCTTWFGYIRSLTK